MLHSGVICKYFKIIISPICLQQKEDKDISADEMENTSTFLYRNNQDTTLDKYSFIDTEPQHTSTLVQKEANVFDFLHSDIQEDQIDEPTLIPEQMSKGTRLEQERFVVHIHGNHKQARTHSVQKQSTADNSARFISTNKMDKPNEKGIKKVVYMKSQSESKMGNLAGVKSKNRWTTRSLDNQVGSDTVFEEDEEEEEEEEEETSNKRTTDGFSLLQHVKTALAITDEPRDAEDTEALPELSQEMGEIMGDETGTSLSKSEMDNRRQKFVPRVPSPLTYENTSEIWDGENVSEMNSPNLEKKIHAEEQKIPAVKRKLQNVEINERRGEFFNTIRRGSLGSHLPGSSEYELSNRTIQNTGRQHSKSVMIPGYEEGQFAELYQIFSSPDSNERRVEDFSTARKGSLGSQVSETSDGAKNSLKQEQHPDHHTLNTMNKKLGDQNVEIRERRGEFPNTVRRGSLGSHLPGSSEYGLSNSTIQNTGRQRSKSVALPGYDEGQFAGLHQLFSSPDAIERRVEDFSTIRKGSLSGQVSGKSENNTSDGAKNSLKQEQHPDHHTLNTMNKKLGDQNVEIRERRGEFPNTVRRGSLGSHLPGSSEYGLSNSTIQNTGRQRSKSVALPGYFFSSPDTDERRGEDFSTARQGSLGSQVSETSEYESLNNTTQSRFLEKYTFDDSGKKLYQELHPNTLKTTNKKLGERQIQKSIVMPMECDCTWEYSPFNDKNSYNQSIKEDSDEYEQSVVSYESPSILGAFERQQTSVKWNPNFQAYSSQEILESIDEEPSNESISVESLHMEKIINEKTSINQFFWTLYFSNPNIMQGYLDVDTWAPSQTAVNLLSEVYLNALDCLANYNEDTEEVGTVYF
jgi:hypothetical protein